MRLRDVITDDNKGHSQFGEAAVVKRIFETIGVKHNRAAECGASDGSDCSNTADLRAQGWSAVLVESDPDRFDALVSNLYEDFAAGWVADSQTQTDDGRLLSKMAGMVNDAERTVAGTLVPNVDGVVAYQMAVTPGNINEVFDGDFDLLSLDVDGAEYALWEALECRPRVVIAEVNQSIPWWMDVRQASHDGRMGTSVSAMCRLAESKQYELVEVIGCNLIFVHFGGLPLDRNYYAVLDELTGGRTSSQIIYDWQEAEPSITWLATDYDGRPRVMGSDPPWGLRWGEPSTEGLVIE